MGFLKRGKRIPIYLFGLLLVAAAISLASRDNSLTVNTGQTSYLFSTTTTTIDPYIVQLEDRLKDVENRIEHVDSELYKSNVDQQAVWIEIRRVSTLKSIDDVWHRLAQCESGDTNANTGNGFYGYFQFDLSTWHSVGGSGYPYQHSYEVQKKLAQKLQAQRGWQPWPACSRKLGLR